MTDQRERGVRPPAHVARATAAAGALLAMMLAACSGPSPAVGDGERGQSADLAARYLYVVDCIGRVDKIDTLQQKLVASHVLTEGAPPLIRKDDTVFNGCTAQAPLINANGTEISMIGTKAVHTDGAYDLQLLTFSLAQWTLVDAKPLGRSWAWAPLRLVRDGDGTMRVMARMARAPSVQFYRAQSADGGTTSGPIQQYSAGVALVSPLPASRPEDALTLGLVDVDASAPALVRAAKVPYTAPDYVHLAPGGAFVVVEEATAPTSRADAPLRTGLLRLYDATGAMLSELHDHALRGSASFEMSFVAITPNGLAVYADRDRHAYHFVRLGRTFANVPVEKAFSSVADRARLRDYAFAPH